jgi:uroporphyrin-III C-methyltransferase
LAKTYIVGAGPGDPGLLTVRALQVLQAAEVVLYDRLVGPGILALIPPSAELIYAGKFQGEQAEVQDFISRTLVEHAKAGRRVVRLKGGDPLIFGRGAEEWRLLHEAGVEVELVPGVSSATAVPGLAGIPPTFRGLADGFAVVTGHLRNEPNSIDWSKYAAVDTLIILMGVRTRVTIARELISYGRPAEQPVAFIEKGATPEERVVVATLREVAEGLVEVENPAVFVAGEVVRLRPFLLGSTIAEVCLEPLRLCGEGSELS